MRGKYGKLAPVIHRNTLSFDKYVIPDRADLPVSPEKIFYEYKVSDSVWASTMFGNDTAGDCVLASFFHMAMNIDAHNDGIKSIPTAADVLALYYKLTGGADTGLDIANTLEVARTDGLLGRKILAWMAVDWTDADKTKLAIALTGGLDVGVQIFQSAEDQFDASKPWNLPNTGPLQGGHSIPYLGKGTAGETCITWATRQPTGESWFQANCDEAYVLIFPEWLEAAGRLPSFTLDLDALTADIKLLS
jgi:hypothetical protein